MATKITYDKQQKILICRVSGYLSVDDYKSYLLEVINSEEYPSDVGALWDLSQMRFDNIDLEFEQQLIDIRHQYNEQRGSAKIALVSDYMLGEPMIKLFKILSEPLLQNVRSFGTISEAQSWLKSK